jgi:DNA repair protein RecO (recombination protein O)
MNSQQTNGIVLNRINFGEADRILTVITPEYGKLRLIAKGVRRIKSKLAGGIELFSISDISFIQGKRDIGTLVSTRLLTHYGTIVTDINRTTAGYNALKLIDKITEDDSEADYYHVLLRTLATLNDTHLSIVLAESWLLMQALKLGGHTPNLMTDAQGAKLEPNTNYQFDFDAQSFFMSEHGMYSDRHIKLMRLLLTEQPSKIAVVGGADQILEDLEGLLKALIKQSTA